MRSKNAVLNIASSQLLQLVTAISGLVISRLILQTFGSSVNGLIASITQFLSYVSLLEAGVGGVIRAELFRPLAEHNNEKISEIVKAAQLFFRRIAWIFSIYILIVAVAYPFVVRGSFSWGYVFTLVIIIGISTLLEYLFCQSYINLLSADQKVWIISLLNSAIVILNIIVLYIAINLGIGIHGVKICGIIVYSIKPIFYTIYVKRHYQLVKTSAVFHIDQKWNGMIHNLAQFIHNNTDIALITLLINVSEVSVYSVYYAVTSGIERIITSVSVGCAAGIGDVIARNEKKQLENVTDLFEFIQGSIATILFSVTGAMIVPFVRLYTEGITDINYIRPVFAYILVLAELLFCIRSIYSTIILNAGHYRQTQINAITEAAVNIVVSLLFIKKFGITGVAIGTLAGMFVRTVMDVLYLSKNIVHRQVKFFIKFMVTNTLIFVFTSLISNLLPVQVTDWISWIYKAALSAFVTVLVAFVIYKFVYPNQVNACIDKVKQILVKNRVRK